MGDRYDAARIDAFLDNCPQMVAFFEEHTALQFVDGNAIPDIHGNVPGAATQGHQVIAAPYDGRELGPLIKRLRKTMRETSFMGMPIMAGADLAAFLSMTRSLKSLLHVSRRFTRHLLDLALYGRAMQLVNGVALIGRLAKSAEKLGVTLIESAPAKRLIVENGAVRGAIVATARGDVEIRAGKGVVLAAGGFPNDVNRRKALFPRAPTGEEHLALPPIGCSGDGISLGESAGGCLATDLASPVAWAPVSRVRHGDGSVGHFPHIIDRAKPGLIGVLADGKAVRERSRRLLRLHVGHGRESAPGSRGGVVADSDHRFQRRYGLGHARPFPIPVGPSVRNGYLQRADSIEDLAGLCGIDAMGLAETVRLYNEHARRGEDPEFGRGSTPYNRKQGDPQHTGGRTRASRRSSKARSTP